MTTTGIPPRKLATFSWILYDFANTIYSMNVVSIYFALWITVNLAKEDLWVSAGNSLSMLFVALTMPFFGTLSDFLKRRMTFLLIFTLICVCATAAIGGAGYFFSGGFLVVLAVLLFTFANYAYQGALVFYNALLPQLATPKNMGKISGYGVAAGYLGAILGLVMVMPFADGQISFLNLEFKSLVSEYRPITQIQPQKTTFLDTEITRDPNYSYQLQRITNNVADSVFHVANSDTVIALASGEKQRAIRVHWETLPVAPHSKWVLLRRENGWGRIGAFIPTALLFLVFAIPIFIFMKESPAVAEEKVTQKISFSKTLKTVWDGLSNTQKYPGVLRFLIAKFFYEEGIETAIIFMGVYAVKVMGFSNDVIIPFFMITTSAAVVGSFLFGFVTDFLGPKNTLVIVISGWVVCLMMLLATTNQSHFWIIGSFVGIFMGSTWTSARPLLLTLVPANMAGEFFGLYSFSGKAASIVGPMIWGLTVYLLRAQPDVIKYKAAVGSLALLMFIGLVLLLRVPNLKLSSQNQPS
jgi:MFS-type transporter involved in bile tolerance (Atg22 family)